LGTDFWTNVRTEGGKHQPSRRPPDTCRRGLYGRRERGIKTTILLGDRVQAKGTGPKILKFARRVPDHANHNPAKKKLSEPLLPDE